jgi:NTP-dependent ternary system trypsin peptidase co-occuring protein
MTAENATPEPSTLPFLVTAEDPADQDTMGVFSRQEAEVVLRQVPVAALRQSLRQAMGTLRSVFEEVADAPGRLRVREVHVAFEVSASGGVRFVGTTEVAGRGTITLVLKE